MKTKFDTLKDIYYAPAYEIPAAHLLDDLCRRKR